MAWIKSHLEVNGDIVIVYYFSNLNLFQVESFPYYYLSVIFCHEFWKLSLFSHILVLVYHSYPHNLVWLNNSIHGWLSDGQSVGVFVCPQPHPARLNKLRHCFDFSLSSTTACIRLSMKGEENYYTLPCNLHWAEVNCFHFGKAPLCYNVTRLLIRREGDQ